MCSVQHWHFWRCKDLRPWWDLTESCLMRYQYQPSSLREPAWYLREMLSCFCFSVRSMQSLQQSSLHCCSQSLNITTYCSYTDCNNCVWLAWCVVLAQHKALLTYNGPVENKCKNVTNVVYNANAMTSILSAAIFSFFHLALIVCVKSLFQSHPHHLFWCLPCVIHFIKCGHIFLALHVFTAA